MRTRIRTILIACLGLVVTGVLLAGCAAPAPTPTPAPAPKPAPTTAPAPATTPKPPAPAPPATPKPTPPPAPAPVSAAEFYRNNPATIYVGYGAGGGADYATRTFASFWKEVTGGTMVAKNMEGASGMALANWMYKTAKPDGLTIGLLYSGASLTGPVLFAKSGVEFDLQKFIYIGSFYQDMPGLAISTKLPYTSLDELRKVKGLKIGTVALRDINALAAALAIEFLGLQDARIVAGYSGTPEMFLAVGRGEIDAVSYTAATILRERGAGTGYFKPIWVVMAEQRSPAFPDAPTLGELVKISPSDAPLLELLSAMASYPVIFAPPGVPQDRVEFLRATFDKMFSNETFVQQMKKNFPVWTKPVSGVNETKNIERVLKVSKVDIDRGNALIDKYSR
ncbi:MAG: hypothetical protein HYX79_06440 [Chloroflexi bacterium]|nr:hypothetical protein [Chloroflexota bacterium]